MVAYYWRFGLLRHWGEFFPVSELPKRGTFPLTAGALGTWQLIAGGVPSTFEIDFVNDRATGGTIDNPSV